MSNQFFKDLGLYHVKDFNHVKTTRPLHLKIDLKPHPPKESVQWTPKTPCSMLSPLTPKIKKLEKFDWFNGHHYDSPSTSSLNGYSPSMDDDDQCDFDKDPSLALMLIDITSPLGQILSKALASLVSVRWPTTTTEEYDRHCNRPPPPPPKVSRTLRPLQGECCIMFDLL